MPLTTSAGLPPAHEWSLRSKRSGQVRTFEQSELTIEGEARLLGIVHEVAVRVTEDGFPWEKVGPLFEDGPTDWPVVIDLVGIISVRAPDAIGNVAACLLGLYPTNEDGSKNDAYDDDVRFLTGALNVVTFVEMLRVFAEQNDYQRLADPIGAILGRAAAPRMATMTTPPTTITPGTSSSDDESADS